MQNKYPATLLCFLVSVHCFLLFRSRSRNRNLATTHPPSPPAPSQTPPQSAAAAPATYPQTSRTLPPTPRAASPPPSPQSAQSLPAIDDSVSPQSLPSMNLRYFPTVRGTPQPPRRPSYATGRESPPAAPRSSFSRNPTALRIPRALSLATRAISGPPSRSSRTGTAAKTRPAPA